MMRTNAIIPSAGLGKRFGAAKQFLTLKGKPILLYALETFGSCEGIDKICLPVPETEIPATEKLVPKALISRIIVVAGGEERQASVQRGFEALPEADAIIVHDGVRPFVTPSMIYNVLQGILKDGACIVGIPVKDTTKRVNDDGSILETVDRKNLWNIQTPQGFRWDLFRKAIQRSREDKFLGTDESMLVERLGHPVKVVLGSPYNMKITVPEDLRIAEAIFKLWKESCHENRAGL